MNAYLKKKLLYGVLLIAGSAFCAASVLAAESELKKIFQPEITITIDTTQNPACFGGTGFFIVTVSGGFGPYTVVATPAFNVPPQQAVVTVTGVDDNVPTKLDNLLAGTYFITAFNAQNMTTGLSVFATLTAPGQLFSMPIVVSNESCTGNKDGKITIVASGGTPFTGNMYEFSINGPGGPFTLATSPFTFEPLAPGLYSVVVQDANGCMTLPASETIQAATPVKATAVSIAPTCVNGADGQIVITASGGTPPYLFALITAPPIEFSPDNVIRGLAAGSYSVVIQDSNGCDLIIANIHVPAGPTFVLESITIESPISCAGALDAVIQADVLGGLFPVQYTLDATGAKVGASANPVFTHVGPGKHTVTITDANTPPCTLTGNVTILSPEPLIIDHVLSIPPLCVGQSTGALAIEVSGGTPPYLFSVDGGLSYSISSLIDGLAAGTYSIIVKDADGCLAMAIGTVFPPSPLQFVSITETDATCAGSPNGSITIIARGGSGGYTYSIDGGVTFSPNNTFTGLAAGTYSIAVMDSNGCITTGEVTIRQPMQLSAIATLVAPGTIAITVEGGTAPFLYSVNNSPFKGSNIFSNLPAGTATVVVKDANGCTATTTVQV